MILMQNDYEIKINHTVWLHLQQYLSNLHCLFSCKRGENRLINVSISQLSPLPSLLIHGFMLQMLPFGTLLQLFLPKSDPLSDLPYVKPTNVSQFRQRLSLPAAVNTYISSHIIPSFLTTCASLNVFSCTFSPIYI